MNIRQFIKTRAIYSSPVLRSLFNQTVLNVISSSSRKEMSGATELVRCLNKRRPLLAFAIVFALIAGPAGADHGDDDELPFGVTSLIIELTDNDIGRRVRHKGINRHRVEAGIPISIPPRVVLPIFQRLPRIINDTDSAKYSPKFSDC